jgi:hypothetical protein
MDHFPILETLMLLCLFATSHIEGQGPEERGKVGLCTIKGKVFRSDSNEAISNSYILLTQQKESAAEVEHFDVKTNEKGEYLFSDIPAGNYTVAIYAWFRNKSDVPCQNPLEKKTDWMVLHRPVEFTAVTEMWSPRTGLVRFPDYTGVSPRLWCDPDDERQFIAMVIPSDLPTTEGWKINSCHHEGVFLIILPASTGPFSR